MRIVNERRAVDPGAGADDAAPGTRIHAIPMPTHCTLGCVYHSSHLSPCMTQPPTFLSYIFVTPDICVNSTQMRMRMRLTIISILKLPM